MPTDNPSSVPLADMAQTFAFHTPALKKLVADFSDQDWLHRPSPDRSHAYWILGHLTACRFILANAAGASLDPQPLMAQFGKGTQPADQITTPVADLFSQFDSAGEQFTTRLPHLTDEQLGADCGRTFPNGSNTIGGQLHFMTFHESFHIGQISMIAYARGKESLV